jgi:ADP-ribose pyrophosphatase
MANIKNTERVYDGFIKVDKLTIEKPGGDDVTREVMVRKDAVAALVFDKIQNNYIFVRQFRPGPASDIVEIVAGTMDVDGETAENCVKREIEEEIGYKTDYLRYIASCYFSPGGTTEKVHIFYAEVSEKLSDGGGVGDENIEIIRTDGDKLFQHLNDSKTLIAIQWLLNKKMSDRLQDLLSNQK